MPRLSTAVVIALFIVLSTSLLLAPTANAVPSLFPFPWRRRPQSTPVTDNTNNNSNANTNNKTTPALGSSFESNVPLAFCTPDAIPKAFKLERIDIIPAPIKAGDPIAVKLVGHLYEKVLPGASIDISIKFFGYSLINMKLGVCDLVENCPLEPGYQELLIKDQYIPWFAPKVGVLFSLCFSPYF